MYEGSAKVEDMEARLVHSLDEAYAVMGDGNIALIVDEAAEIRKEFCPDVVVDAILAKKNLGTKITDAPLVVASARDFMRDRTATVWWKRNGDIPLDR